MIKKTKWCCKNWCEKGFNLATTTALTAVENKIPNVSNLAKKADYNAKIWEMEKKYFLLLLIIISSQVIYLMQRCHKKVSQWIWFK